MKPNITPPRTLAKKRFTSKVRKPANLDLIDGVKANHGSQVSAIEYLAQGQRISTSSGLQLDAWGEKAGIPRDGMSDDEYKIILVEQGGGASLSQQSRPAIGSFISSTHHTQWLNVDSIGLPGGAVGASFNRSPLGRMIYLQCKGMAPDIRLSESLVSATFAATAYSAATAPNIKPTQHAPALPGNAFFSVWGGLRYHKVFKVIRLGPGVTVRAKAGMTVNTGQTANEIVSTNQFVGPRNTFLTVKNIEVVNG